MHDLPRQLITEWRRLELPFENKVVVLAVSGGADSSALALAFADLFKRKKIKHRVIIAHFDHDLRGQQSRKDAEFVKKLANDIGFEFICETGNIDIKGNLEQNARVARYDFLHRVAEEVAAFAILTAHTLNDQAETFLLNLIRGSGIDGLKAMPPIRKSTPTCKDNTHDIILVRPFLRTVKREETEAYCNENGIMFCIDDMNNDVAYKRVRIRKELLPTLKEYNPKIIETLANTAELINMADTRIGLPENTKFEEKLKLSDLVTISKPELNNLLREWIKIHRGGLRGISAKHINAINNLVHSTKSGRIAELPGGEKVEKHSGMLVYKCR